MKEKKWEGREDQNTAGQELHGTITGENGRGVIKKKQRGGP